MLGGGAAAELIDTRGLDRSLLLAQVSELLVGVGGESAGGGAVRDAVAARRGGGRHQVIPDGLAQPGPQPGRQPGPVLDGGQPLSEASLLTARGLAAPPGLAPVQQDLPVADEHVAGCRPGMLLDPRGRLAAPGAAARRFRRGVGDHLDQGLPVLGLRHRRDQQPGDPQQDRRRGAARRAGRRGLRGHGGAGSVQRRRFLLRISVSWSKRESLGNRLLSSSSRNSQTNPWICGRGRAQFTGRSRAGMGNRVRTGQRIRRETSSRAAVKEAGARSGIQRRAAWRSLAHRKGRKEPCRGRSRKVTRSRVAARAP